MSSEPSPAQHAALDARFEIVRELGRGGTAIVYLARERSTGEEVAIKLIRAKYLEDAEAVARFEREARFVAQLDHPNIVPVRSVLDLGNSGLALVMAHVDGRTLRQISKAEGRSSPASTERVLRDIGNALGAAHDRKIVHRDVKPENIFIAADGRALLADFGLARSMTGDTQLTMAGIAIGTPAYMAPEQIEGIELDGRADVYSLGLVGWEMLSGRRPWDGQSLYSVLYHQKHEILPDVRALRDDVPDRLASVIVRAIEKEREARWPNVRSFLIGLREEPAPQPRPVRERITASTTRFMRPASPPTPPVSLAPPTPSVSLARLTPPVSLAPPTRLEPSPATMSSTTRDSLLAIAEQFDGDDDFSEWRSVPARSGRRMAAALVATTAIAVIVFTAVALWRSSKVASPGFAASPALAADKAQPLQSGGALVPPPATADTTRRALTDTIAQAKRLPPNTAGAPQPEAAAVVLPLTIPKPTPAPAPQIVTVDPSSPAAHISIVAGGTHTCYTNADGRAFCWGNNDRGQLGDGSAARATAPLPVGADARFSTVSAGLSHSCALTSDGATWCWGSNEHGQLGNGSAGQRLAAVHTATAHTFRAISAGAAHTCGLDADGIAWCWGSNSHGQLGDSIKGDHVAPVRVGAGESRFANIVAGWNFTCGLVTDGHVRCWGENSAGQLGDGTTTDRDRPAPVRSDLAFTSLGAGSEHVCGVTLQHEVYCWGRNANGQLGDGTNVDRTTPVRVSGTAHFTSITAGAVHTCAIADDGAAYCWGRNTYGQLGNGTDVDQSRPTPVSGGHTFASVHAFGSHTCGATSTGQAYCWGYNLDGQLGDGTRIHRTRPAPVELPRGDR